jgi:bifunctional non-homologous end joining protein LigD
MTSRFVVHRHKTERPHYDLRLIQGEVVRSWSLLREPSCEAGDSRLAIERESLAPDDLEQKRFVEAAFGEGAVWTWDEGKVEIRSVSPGELSLDFRGDRLTGEYRLRRTRWYPGNRWLLEKRAVATEI